MSRYVKEATRLSGDSGVNLMRLLEMRLDNVAYRLGFANTRAQARQMVNHGLIVVNGRSIDIPSHHVQAGDTVGVKETKKGKGLFDGLSERLAVRDLPSWLSCDAGALSGKILHAPAKEDGENVFDITLVIEYYSSR